MLLDKNYVNDNFIQTVIFVDNLWKNSNEVQQFTKFIEVMVLFPVISRLSSEGNYNFITVTCQDRSLSDGNVDFDRDPVDNSQYGLYPVNTTSTFRCRDGYSVFGHNSSTCQISGRWSEPAPTCGGKGIEDKLLYYVYLVEKTRSRIFPCFISFLFFD